MKRATLADVETVGPNNYGAGGGYRISCPGGCDLARQRGGAPIWGHRYYYGYNKRTALAQWRSEHPRESGKQ